MKRLLSVLLLSAVLLLAAAEKLTVIGTTDIHGHLFSSAGRPNLLKLLQAVSDEVRTAGKENTLLIDCGDLIQGSPEVSIDRGKTVLQLLNSALFVLQPA